MDVIGGGVLVAAAAALWIAYLLPSWLRRRQYLATERNAVRLPAALGGTWLLESSAKEEDL